MQHKIPYSRIVSPHGMTSSVILAILLVVGCKNTTTPSPAPLPVPADTTLSFFLGDSRGTVHGHLGTPDRRGKHMSGVEFESYFTHGLAVEYGPNDTVVVITATWFPGNHFTGKICGVSLGDHKDQYVAALGEPNLEEATSAEYSTLVWICDGFQIEMEAWNRDDELDPWGEFSRGDIKEIRITSL